MRPDEVRDFLRPLPVGRLWGVGPVTEAALRAAGIATVGDLADARARTAAAARRLRLADVVRGLARGEDVRVVDAERDARSYGEENTFGTDVRDDRTVREAIIAHGEAVARRLRRDGVRARTVVLKIKLAERLGAGKYRILTRQAPLRRRQRRRRRHHRRRARALGSPPAAARGAPDRGQRARHRRRAATRSWCCSTTRVVRRAPG